MWKNKGVRIVLLVCRRYATKIGYSTVVVTQVPDVDFQPTDRRLAFTPH